MQLAAHVLSTEKHAGLVKISQIENAAREERFFFNPLAGEAHGNGKQATDEALYYVFSDTIKQAVKKALEESLAWPFKETISRAPTPRRAVRRFRPNCPSCRNCYTSSTKRPRHSAKPSARSIEA